MAYRVVSSLLGSLLRGQLIYYHLMCRRDLNNPLCRGRRIRSVNRSLQSSGNIRCKARSAGMNRVGTSPADSSTAAGELCLTIRFRWQGEYRE